MEQENKISIIVPAYNVQDYISQCIDSLIHQTYQNVEIIVINDGSQDDTLPILQEYAQKDHRIIVVNQQNQGVSASRNEGLKIASGDYIMFCDGDDWYDLNACEIALETLLNSQADIAMFGYVREYQDNSLPKAMFEEDKLEFVGQEIKEKLHRRIFGPLGEETTFPEKLNAITTIWGKLYKAELIKNLRFVNLNEVGLCEDGIFNIYAFQKAQKIVFEKKYLYHYRKVISGNSLTQKKEDNFFEKEKKFYTTLYDIMIKENLGERYITSLHNRMAISMIEMGIRFSNQKKGLYRNLENVIKNELYQKAIKQFDLNYLPFHWKVFFWNVKHGCIFMTYLMVLAIAKLANKK